MTLKIHSKTFKQFLDTVTLGGVIESAVLELNSTELNVKLKNSNDTIFSIGSLKAEAFEEFVSLDYSVGIKNTKLLIELLSSFNDIVNIDITPSLFNVYTTKKVASLVLAQPEYLKTFNLPYVPDGLNNFDEGVVLDSSIFYNTKNNCKILDSNDILISVKNKELSIRSGNDSFDKITEKVECDYKDVTSKFSFETIKKVIDTFTDTVTISILSEGAPIQFTTALDTFTSRIIVAPMSMDDEEDTTSSEQSVDEEE